MSSDTAEAPALGAPLIGTIATLPPAETVSPPSANAAPDASTPTAGGAPDASAPAPVDPPLEPPCVLGPFGAPQRLTESTQVDFWSPALSADGLTLYFGASTADTPEHIYVTTRADRGAQFAPVTALPNVNSAAADGAPIESFDGLTLYLYSTRPGGLGGRDLWRATRQARSADFGAPSRLANVNSNGFDQPGWVSADERALIFSSTRAGGAGSADLWLARRASLAEDFAAPVPVAGINTAAYEGRATLSSDQLSIIFASNRPGGLGDNDLWIAARPDVAAAFGPATRLTEVNSAADDIDPQLTADDRELFFASNRPGRSELWRAVRDCQ
jgi:Tol biopolymer transport system component